VALELPHFLARGVPETDEAVEASRCEQHPVGRERYRAEGLIANPAKESARLRVEHTQALDISGGNDLFAVR